MTHSEMQVMEIRKIIDECEYVQEGYESKYTKDCEKIKEALGYPEEP